jgi:hypothetical protein
MGYALAGDDESWRDEPEPDYYKLTSAEFTEFWRTHPQLSAVLLRARPDLYRAAYPLSFADAVDQAHERALREDADRFIIVSEDELTPLGCEAPPTKATRPTPEPTFTLPSSRSPLTRLLRLLRRHRTVER